LPNQTQGSFRHRKGSTPERVAVLFNQLRDDHFRALDRLNQNPTNSSRPPSSQAPWEKSPDKDEDDTDNHPHSSTPSDEKQPLPSHNGDKTQHVEVELKRKPGKQPGAPGFGRTQKFTDVQEETHKPELCRGCNKVFPPGASFTATMGFETVDLILPQPGKIGITGSCTKHIYGTCSCDCGFETASKPHRSPPESGWTANLGEWKLIGPMLLAFIVFAKLRLHLTIDKTKILLATWFGISLSKGTIGNALLEAGRAVSDLEPEGKRVSRELGQKRRCIWCEGGCRSEGSDGKCVSDAHTVWRYAHSRTAGSGNVGSSVMR